MFQFLSKAFRASPPEPDSGRHAPIFLVGCGHSGTSLLLAILGTHSGIHAIPRETYLAIDPDTRTARLAPDAREQLRSFAKLTHAQGKRRWIEKTPSHIHALAQLFELCPTSKILLVIRDGRDVACSIQDRSGDLAEGIRRWVADNRAGQKFWAHPQVHVLRYESIIEDFRGTLTTALSFLGEEFEEPLSHHDRTPHLFYSDKIQKPPDAFGQNHAEYRNWQINQPLFDGRGKWKRLSDKEKTLIKEIAGDMLSEYGYVTGNDW